MRIIAGSARGRRLATPGRKVAKPLIRPTADRAREAVFSILGARVTDAVVLDLFAGTGALALEALSRGARRAVLVDKLPQAIELINHNVGLCGFSEDTIVMKRDLLKGLFFMAKMVPAPEFSLVFLDPPYGRQLADKLLTELGGMALITAGAMVVAEENTQAQLADSYGPLVLIDQRRYGDTAFWMYESED